MSCPWEFYRDSLIQVQKEAIRAMRRILSPAAFRHGADRHELILEFIHSPDFSELCQLAALDADELRAATRALLARPDLLIQKGKGGRPRSADSRQMLIDFHNSQPQQGGDHHA